MIFIFRCLCIRWCLDTCIYIIREILCYLQTITFETMANHIPRIQGYTYGMAWLVIDYDTISASKPTHTSKKSRYEISYRNLCINYILSILCVKLTWSCCRNNSVQNSAKELWFVHLGEKYLVYKEIMGRR